MIIAKPMSYPADVLLRLGKLVPPDLKKPVFNITKIKKLVIAGKCACCKIDIYENDFCDKLSCKEYTISGMCKKCQNEVFNY